MLASFIIALINLALTANAVILLHSPTGETDIVDLDVLEFCDLQDPRFANLDFSLMDLEDWRMVRGYIIDHLTIDQLQQIISLPFDKNFTGEEQVKISTILSKATGASGNLDSDATLINSIPAEARRLEARVSERASNNQPPQIRRPERRIEVEPIEYDMNNNSVKEFKPLEKLEEEIIAVVDSNFPSKSNETLESNQEANKEVSTKAGDSSKLTSLMKKRSRNETENVVEPKSVKPFVVSPNLPETSHNDDPQAVKNEDAQQSNKLLESIQPEPVARPLSELAKSILDALSVELSDQIISSVASQVKKLNVPETCDLLQSFIQANMPIPPLLMLLLSPAKVYACRLEKTALYHSKIFEDLFVQSMMLESPKSKTPSSIANEKYRYELLRLWNSLDFGQDPIKILREVSQSLTIISQERLPMHYKQRIQQFRAGVQDLISNKHVSSSEDVLLRKLVSFYKTGKVAQ